jgi:hypothetical protein
MVVCLVFELVALLVGARAVEKVGYTAA